MAYTEFTNDDNTAVDSRLYPTAQTCHKDTGTSTSAEYILLPRDVKTITLYATAAHWVRVDKVDADPTSARDLSDTSKDNVLYVPDGTFVIAQNTEFNCVSYKTATSTGEIYLYPGYSGKLNGLVAEVLAS